MKALADRRARVARVRRVQHLQAVGAAAQAEGKLDQLSSNNERLSMLRASLASDMGAATGATLSNAGELAMRLEEARHGLTRAIDSAREAVALRTAERLGAHVARETAERLQDRAVAEMQRIIEERMQAAFRPRPARSENGGGGDDA